jgi:ABC-2 type transport system permease protein
VGIYLLYTAIPCGKRAPAGAAAHVFEGMRAMMFSGQFPLAHLAAAFGVDAIYLAIGIGAFLVAFEIARRRGSPLQSGE